MPLAEPSLQAPSYRIKSYTKLQRKVGEIRSIQKMHASLNHPAVSWCEDYILDINPFQVVQKKKKTKNLSSIEPSSTCLSSVQTYLSISIMCHRLIWP